MNRIRIRSAVTVLLFGFPAIISVTNALAESCLPRPVSCVRTSPYGWRMDPLKKDEPKFHGGTDYGCAQGTPVQSAMSGNVEFSGWSNDGGNMTTIVDGTGLRTKYLHNSKLIVTIGEKVQSGQVLALSGNTGHRTTGPHLHFVVMPSLGKAVDPESRLCGGKPSPPPGPDVVSVVGGSTPPIPQSGLDGSPRSILLDIISSRSLNSDYAKQLAVMPEDRMYAEINYLYAVELKVSAEKLKIKERIGTLISTRTALINEKGNQAVLDAKRKSAMLSSVLR